MYNALECSVAVTVSTGCSIRVYGSVFMELTFIV